MKSLRRYLNLIVINRMKTDVHSDYLNNEKKTNERIFLEMTFLTKLVL
jgi:hypothetical protein